MNFIADSCSIILLAKANVLEDFVNWKKVVIARAVYDEVVEGKKKKFFDALLTERLCNEKKLKIIDIKNIGLLKKLKEDYGLGDGEAETIAAYLEEKFKGLITDNRQGRKTAKVYNIEPIGSISIILSLFKANKINKSKVMDALHTLRKYGWFEDSLIYYAIEEVEND